MTRRRKTILAASLLALVLAAAAVALFLRRGKPPAEIVEVPLGVEEAVIITADSSDIEPAPFAWGVAVNVRIAAVRQADNGRVYDVRYIVNRAGDYDLKDYLRFADGKASAGLPSFKIRGLERLTKDIEARIAETEATGVGLRSWYYETLALLTAGWIGWLLLLIFAHRRNAPVAAPQQAGPTLADQIRAYLRQFEAGALDAGQQAEMEMMIFRQWRTLRGWDDRPMFQCLSAFRADPNVAEAFSELESFLHRRNRTTSPTDVADAVRSRLDPQVPPVPSPAVPPEAEAEASGTHSAGEGTGGTKAEVTKQ